MAYEFLLYQKQDGIGTITFHRPKELNALNRRSLEELEAVLEEARRDDEVRVLILTGSGEKAFVAGADINELAQQTPLGGREMALYGQGVFRQARDAGQAFDCRDQWFRAGRRLRIGAGLFDSPGEPHGEARPAGSEAGHHVPGTAARSGWRGCAGREWRRSCA